MVITKPHILEMLELKKEEMKPVQNIFLKWKSEDKKKHKSCKTSRKQVTKWQ